jgi:hypothetical protein
MKRNHTQTSYFICTLSDRYDGARTRRHPNPSVDRFAEPVARRVPSPNRTAH